MKERELVPRSINSLVDLILRSLVLDFSWEQLTQVISWQKFTNLNLIVNLPNGSYGLNLINSLVEVRSFLEELIKVRMSNDPEQWEKFLSETNKYPDEFFDQPLGKFEDPNIRPITLSQLNAAIINMLERGVRFEFNGQKEKNE